MTTRKHLPPASKFAPNAAAQAKPAPAAARSAVSIPQTKFAQPVATVQAKAVPQVTHSQPATKFGPGGSVQAKADASVRHLPPATPYTGQAGPTLQRKAMAPPAQKYGMPQKAGSMPPRGGTLQRMVSEKEEQAESAEENVIRILKKRGIIISKEEAAKYAAALVDSPPNTLVPIKGRHRALKMSSVGLISSVEWRPPSDASRMRVSPNDEPAYDMMTNGPRPLVGGIWQNFTTIDSQSLAHIPDRPSLNPIMGGSASKLSGIDNSEWLHMVAHSLGGADTQDNLVAGPHSLNTAMIPFERFVRTAVQQGVVVDYDITFFTETEGSVPYVHHVEVSITLSDGQSGTWTLEVNPDKRDEFINGETLDQIEAAVKKFAGN